MLSGKFRLERQIGSGGMGVVYQATDIGLRRTVAIKTLPKMSQEACIRLLREARTMAAVVHPNLAIIHGAETWRGTPMLIIEFLAGGTLAQRLRSGPLAISEAINLGLVLANVLEKTHAKAILHRDIKPSNIGFSEEGTPKLHDFGLARIVSQSDAFSEHQPLPLAGGETLTMVEIETSKQRLIGTPAYLVPEALENNNPDDSWDLWSLGLVLYEAIAGSNPFVARTVKETIHRVSQMPIPNLQELRSDCPDAVAEFFRNALSRDPARRPSGARQFRSELAKLGTVVAG